MERRRRRVASGVKEAHLTGVACTSSSACTVVGSYQNSAGTTVTLAEQWNGGGWTIQTTPNPEGAAEWAFTGISCTT